MKNKKKKAKTNTDAYGYFSLSLRSTTIVLSPYEMVTFNVRGIQRSTKKKMVKLVHRVSKIIIIITKHYTITWTVCVCVCAHTYVIIVVSVFAYSMATWRYIKAMVACDGVVQRTLTCIFLSRIGSCRHRLIASVWTYSCIHIVVRLSVAAAVVVVPTWTYSMVVDTIEIHLAECMGVRERDRTQPG